MAKIRQLQLQRREQLVLAYQIGAFVGFSKLPPLAKVLQKLDQADQRREPRAPMSEAEIMHVMGLWAVAMSGRYPDNQTH